MARKHQKFFAEGLMVLVEWNDAWHAERDNHDNLPLALRIVGYVQEHDQDGIKLAMETPAPVVQTSPRHICFVPTGMVTKITPLVKAK